MSPRRIGSPPGVYVYTLGYRSAHTYPAGVLRMRGKLAYSNPRRTLA
jgi:hypothetical protein